MASSRFTFDFVANNGSFAHRVESHRQSIPTADDRRHRAKLHRPILDNLGNTNWFSLLTTNPSAASVTILDPDATNSARFYRARVGP